MATIDTVTDSSSAQAAEPATAQTAEPTPAAAPAAAADNRHSAAQHRFMTLVVTVFGTIIAALIGGMFLFVVSAFDDVRSEFRSEIGGLRSEMGSEIGGLRSEFRSEIGGLRSEMGSEIGGLRSEMNARFAEADRKFDQIIAVLLDHTDRLARIETTLDISGRPLASEIDASTDP